MDDKSKDSARRLEELQAHIDAQRRALQNHSAIGDQLQREWDDMLRQHAELRRRLRAGEAAGSAAGATLNQDIDVLRHAFFRWAARVDERFKSPRKAGEPS